MGFATDIVVGIGVTLVCFLLFSAGILVRQRRRRRRSVHWFAVFLLAGLVGMFSGMALHLSGTDTMADPPSLTRSIELNQDAASSL